MWLKNIWVISPEKSMLWRLPDVVAPNILNALKFSLLAKLDCSAELAFAVRYPWDITQTCHRNYGMFYVVCSKWEFLQAGICVGVYLVNKSLNLKPLKACRASFWIGHLTCLTLFKCTKSPLLDSLGHCETVCRVIIIRLPWAQLKLSNEVPQRHVDHCLFPSNP